MLNTAHPQLLLLALFILVYLPAKCWQVYFILHSLRYKLLGLFELVSIIVQNWYQNWQKANYIIDFANYKFLFLYRARLDSCRRITIGINDNCRTIRYYYHVKKIVGRINYQARSKIFHYLTSSFAIQQFIGKEEKNNLIIYIYRLMKHPSFIENIRHGRIS